MTETFLFYLFRPFNDVNQGHNGENQRSNSHYEEKNYIKQVQVLKYRYLYSSDHCLRFKQCNTISIRNLGERHQLFI